MRRHSLPLIGSWRAEGGSHTVVWRYTDTSVIADYPFSMGAWALMYGSTVLMNLGASSTTNPVQQAHRLAHGGTSFFVGSTTNLDTTAQGTEYTAIYGGRRWHHALAVWTSATDRKIYVDGRLAGSNTTNRSPATPYPTLSIGGDNQPTPSNGGGGGQLWPAVWDVALTQADAQALWMGAAPIEIAPNNLRYFLPNFETGQCYVTGINFTQIKNVATQQALLQTIPPPIQLTRFDRQRIITFGHLIGAGGPIALDTGLSTETDSALARSTVSRPSIEIDSSQTLTRVKQRPVLFKDNSAAGSELSIALSQIKKLATQFALEVSTAFALTFAAQVGFAQEVDSAQAVNRVKIQAVQAAVETDSAQALSRQKVQTVQATTETDSAQTLAKQKSKTVQISSEIDSSLAQARVKIKTTEFGVESDSALQLDFGLTTRPVGQSNETDSAQALARRKSKDVQISSEIDSSVACTRVKAKTTGLGTETDSSQALSRIKSKAIDFGTEVDSAFQLDFGLATRPVGLATEADSAQVLALRKVRATSVSSETDSSLALTKSKSRIVGFGAETDTAFELAFGADIRPVGLASESDSALELARAKSKSIAFGGEADSAFFPTTGVVTRPVGISEEYNNSDPGVGGTYTTGNNGHLYGGANQESGRVLFARNGLSIYSVDRYSGFYQHFLTSPWQPATINPFTYKRFSPANDVSGPFGAPNTSTAPPIYYLADSDRFLYISLWTGTVIHQYEMTTPNDIETLTYTSKSFDFGSTIIDPIQSFVVSLDGTKLIIRTSNAFYLYNFGTPFDITTVSYTGVSRADVSSYTAISITDDGLYMLAVSAVTVPNVMEWHLPTPWDLSGAITKGQTYKQAFPELYFQRVYVSHDGSFYYGQETENIKIPSEEQFPVFSRIVYRFERKGFGQNAKYFYTPAYSFNTHLSRTNYTPSFYQSLRDVSLGNNEADPKGSRFNPDGTKFFLVGDDRNSIVEYSLSTPWNISTLSFVREFIVSGQTTSPNGLHISPDGTNLYLTSATSPVIVYQYTLNNAWSLLGASYTGKTYTCPVYPSPETTNGIDFKPDGTRMFLLGFIQVDLATPWDLSTAVFDGYLGFYFRNGLPNNFRFNSDGKELFVWSSGEVFKVRLKTAWELRTFVASENVTDYKSLGAYDSGLEFGSDGLFLYLGVRNTLPVLGRIAQFQCVPPRTMVARKVPSGYYQRLIDLDYPNNRLREWRLTVPDDITSAVFEDVAHNLDGLMGSAASSTTRFTISSDGKYLIYSGGVSRQTRRATFGKPWDITSLGVSYIESPVTFATVPYAYCCRPDGGQITAYGTSGGNVKSHSMNPAWDVTSITDPNGDLGGAQPPSPGITSQYISPDGVYHYGVQRTIATSTRFIYRNVMTTPWDLNTAPFPLLNTDRYSSTTLPVPGDFAFNQDGTKAWLGSDGSLLQYSVSPAWSMGFTPAGSKSGVRLSFVVSPLLVVISRPTDFATELDASFALQYFKSQNVLTAEEFDFAYQLNRLHVQLYGISNEFDVTPIYTMPLEVEGQRRLWTRFVE